MRIERDANTLETADPERWPDLPRMIAIGDGLAPGSSAGVRDTGVGAAVLADLTLKAAYTVPQFTTEWAARRLHLPQPLVGELLEQLRTDHLLEVLGSAGPFGYRYTISQRGRERAGLLFEISGYVGPAPVSLESYTAMLDWQLARTPEISPERVEKALSALVLPDEAGLIAGLAFTSGRSLFLHGPPGNGKTSLGRMTHGALEGDLWIPHCIGVDGSIIRLYDPQCHQSAESEAESSWMIDRRWVKIRRPLIVVGGEVTIDSFELTYSPALRSYEAPLHVKANGGTFLIDDFGRQRVEPHQLLNRWIIPLEHQFDHLTLQTGQKIQVPFRQMLIIATNLDPDVVMDQAFLRRMGYRLHLGMPTPERYAQIFERHAARRKVWVPPGLIARLLDRYRAEGRELRCCEPRDLIERGFDLCRFRGRAPELNEEVLDLAWIGYFGNASRSK